MLRLFLSRFLEPFRRRVVPPAHAPRLTTQAFGEGRVPARAGQATQPGPGTPSPLTEVELYGALRTVIDPELGLDVVDLGLIYSVERLSSKVLVRMTLTTRGCPMQESLVWGVRRALLTLESVEEVDVEVVWDPPWHPSMMGSSGEMTKDFRSTIGSSN